MFRARPILATAAAAGALLAPSAAAATPADAGDAVHARVVGGSKAKQGAYPWMARLEVTYNRPQTNYLCGGTLISKDTVLTSAQCLATVKGAGSPTRIKVYVGQVDHTDAADEGAIRYGTRYQLGRGVARGDWAVVKLDQAYKAESYPVLAADDAFDDEDEYRALGWGRTDANAKPAATLRQVDLPTARARECDNDTTELCTGTPRDPEVGTCAGDQGGPLLAPLADRRAGSWVQVGVTSVPSCAQEKRVDRFTRISEFADAVLDAVDKVGGTAPTTTDDRR